MWRSAGLLSPNLAAHPVRAVFTCFVSLSFTCAASQNSFAPNFLHSSVQTQHLRGSGRRLRWWGSALVALPAVNSCCDRLQHFYLRTSLCVWWLVQERKATLRSLLALGSVSCLEHVMLRGMSLSIRTLEHMTVTQTVAVQNGQLPSV